MNMHSFVALHPASPLLRPMPVFKHVEKNAWEAAGTLVSVSPKAAGREWQSFKRR